MVHRMQAMQVGRVGLGLDATENRVFVINSSKKLNGSDACKKYRARHAGEVTRYNHPIESSCLSVL